MKYDLNSTIDSVEEVREFAEFMVKELQIAYCPGDDFEMYLDDKGKPLFTDDEAETYNNLAMDCILFCEMNNLDFEGMVHDAEIEAYPELLKV